MLFNLASSFLVELPRPLKKSIVLILDIVLVAFSTWLAFCLRFDVIVSVTEPLIYAIVISLLISIPVFITFGLYRAIYRFTGWFASIALMRAIVLYALIYAAILFVLRVEGVPRSVGFIQPILLFIFVGISRLLAKIILNLKISKKSANKRSIALIYGAGSAGRQLASALRQGFEINPIGFVDDDPHYWGSTINGLSVYSPNQIPKLLTSNIGISDVLLAIPSAPRSRQKEVLANLSNLPVRVRILPGIGHIANGIVKVEDVREVEIDDVLGRDPVEPNINLLHQNISKKVVLVTGAGGSIGSELCRQILDQNPDVLILFELNEFALYAIERELLSKPISVKVIPVLGSVLDKNKLIKIMEHFNVQTVYHAAAYKHVPMIEMNPAAGVWNNVFGTLRTVEAACQVGVETFVLISTDKAVRPTNVMGCSKRLAELVLQAMSIEEDKNKNRPTRLTMVRFGNVLGSSGSVVPVFREQIKAGGPVTVTHPEIIRYFMTIPEAAQLVIQAGAIGEGGDVMVLDMGEPIKIVDLAKRMIHLSGFSYRDELNPDGDIEISFSGLRPGEKLYEELLIGGEILPTSHVRIMRSIEDSLSISALKEILGELELAVKDENGEVVRSLLKKAVPEFVPQSGNADVMTINTMRGN